MAAERLAQAGVNVTLFDRMASPGRKFLMAGRGGLNLTHSEPLDTFLDRYGSARDRLGPAIEAFSPAMLRAWCEGLGQATFVGSSGRIFPECFKTSPLLRAWLGRLAGLGVGLRSRHTWLGWDEAGALRYATPTGETTFAADVTLLALGGASWPRLGADGGWVDILRHDGIRIEALKPSNCGFETAWSEVFRSRFAGTPPLHTIALVFEGKRLRGEAVVTDYGLEGGAIYALSPGLRDAIVAKGEAWLGIDLRPDVELGELGRRLARPRGSQSLSTFLRKTAGLAPVAIALLRETGALPADPGALAALIKAVPIRLTASRGLDRAISTAGGIAFDELDACFMLKRRPGTFAAGEMLDWEAPTGGYLLQATFSTAVAAAAGMLEWLGQRPAR
jgi:uncharacterized flavoprotein (TIGR03862 family)